jgi:hypothetical protein
MPRKQREAAMKALLFLGIALALVFAGGRAEAQNYPWCAQYGEDFGDVLNCGFVSFDQCMLTVRGMGGFCIENNRYQPPGAAVAPSHRVKRHSAPKPS